jgi:hypothetical protein
VRGLLYICNLAAGTCPHAHGCWAALISSAPDAQLAVLVGPPAPEAAVATHGTRVITSRSYERDSDACCSTIDQSCLCYKLLNLAAAAPLSICHGQRHSFLVFKMAKTVASSEGRTTGMWSDACAHALRLRNRRCEPLQHPFDRVA